MLSRRRVRVNGQVFILASRRVEAGDLLEIGRGEPPDRTRGIRIFFEDEDLLVVGKPAGLLTVATPHERERTVFAFLRDYLQAERRGEKPFIVHRLDRFASGILVFAKSQAIKEALQAQFQKHTVERKYWAIVEGAVASPEGTIESRLAENRAGRMHSTVEPEAGKRAVTHYRVLSRFPSVTALEITLETGRKNQIRAHLSEIGHPIVGDRGYGSTTDPLKRLGLHAFVLGFKHPAKGKRLVFKSDPPSEFRKYLTDERGASFKGRSHKINERGTRTFMSRSTNR
jgi:23S rRNA pseudouridine1911/1915/1917 synthase